MLIVHIDKWQFQLNSLFGYEMVDRCIITILSLQSIRTENAVSNVVGWKRKLS